MSGTDLLRSFAESREHDAIIIKDGITYGDVRDALRELTALRARVAELSDKALRFDLDQAGITAREREAVELVELRARVEGLEWRNRKLRGIIDNMEDLLDPNLLDQIGGNG